ncbi:MAG: aminoglycoside phosphotransferase family protein [Candidatus Nomurabacteria bacterium]|jgi:Ser/Thr protein kinase RdoA (MazF antagonist)|nr:aminoglycoside phosphotransferase family protein [Candidatus Nomurabacteria bacterium]
MQGDFSKRHNMCEGYAINAVAPQNPPISDANVLRLAQAFGLARPCIFAYNHGYRNHSFGVLAGDARYNLLLLKNEPDVLKRIKNADKVAEIAHLAGMPVRTLASPKTLKIASNGQTRFARLYFWLDGDTIPWEAYTRKHLKALGKSLAELHVALGGQTPPSTPSLPDALQELVSHNTQMQAYFAREGVKNALKRKLHLKTRQNHAKIASFLASDTLQNLPRQPLHLDFVRGNILWDGSQAPCVRACDDPCSPRISGIIDFEKSALGSPLIDLARTYAFLLVDCPKAPGQIRKYFLCKGYSCVFPAKIFAQLTNFFLIFDFYKFLAHNPYESLENNYHFCRTRDILVSRKILEDI